MKDEDPASQTWSYPQQGNREDPSRIQKGQITYQNEFGAIHHSSDDESVPLSVIRIDGSCLYDRDTNMLVYNRASATFGVLTLSDMNTNINNISKNKR